MQLRFVSSQDIIKFLNIPLCKSSLPPLCLYPDYYSLLLFSYSSTANSLQMLPSCASAQPHILWCSRQVTYCNKSLLINCCKYLISLSLFLTLFSLSQHFIYILKLLLLSFSPFLPQSHPLPYIILARLGWQEVTILQKEDLRSI